MSNQQVRVMVPPRVAVPRGAVWLGTLVGAVVRLLRPPVLTPQQREERDRALEVTRVRALADSHRHTDPGFASDLHAAAARYEQAFEEAASSLRRAKR